MSQKIIITISNDIPISASKIGRLIEDSLAHLKAIEVTVTPDTIDVYRGKEFSDITVTGATYKLLEKAAKSLDVPVTQILRRGEDKLRSKGDL